MIVPVPDTKVHVPVSPLPPFTAFPARVVLATHMFWSAPASASVKSPLRVTSTSSVLGVQVPLLIVQRNTVGVALSKFSMAAVGVFSSPATTFPGPLTTLHVPVPTAGAFPARLPPAVHTEKSVPALDVVGASS